MCVEKDQIFVQGKQVRVKKKNSLELDLEIKSVEIDSWGEPVTVGGAWKACLGWMDHQEQNLKNKKLDI